LKLARNDENRSMALAERAKARSNRRGGGRRLQVVFKFRAAFRVARARGAQKAYALHPRHRPDSGGAFGLRWVIDRPAPGGFSKRVLPHERGRALLPGRGSRSSYGSLSAASTTAASKDDAKRCGSVSVPTTRSRSTARRVPRNEGSAGLILTTFKRPTNARSRRYPLMAMISDQDRHRGPMPVAQNEDIQVRVVVDNAATATQHEADKRGVLDWPSSKAGEVWDMLSKAGALAKEKGVVNAAHQAEAARRGYSLRDVRKLTVGAVDHPRCESGPPVRNSTLCGTGLRPNDAQGSPLA